MQFGINDNIIYNIGLYLHYTPVVLDVHLIDEAQRNDLHGKLS